MRNTRETVVAVIKMLDLSGVRCALFGGWAEELLGLREQGAHRDIDLLYCADTFAAVDSVLRDSAHDITEVALKRFRHKRAFLFDQTLCEIILVQHRDDCPMTLFWGDVPFRWERPLLHQKSLLFGGEPISLVSAANLERYRRLHKQTEPHRWQQPDSLEP